MEKVIDFIVEHYELLILLAACMLDVILFLCGVFKKRFPSVSYSVQGLLPNWINEAEEKFGAGLGREKRDYVLQKVRDFYQRETGEKLGDCSIFLSWVFGQIEDILSTPQKKGK